MKQIQLIALLLAAAGLTACSSDEGTGTVEAPLKMIVDVTENPFTDISSSAKARVATRTAAVTTTESLDAFSMNYTQDFKYDFNKSKTSGKWTDTNTWPSGVNVCDFYAYTGGTFNFKDSNGTPNPYIAFTVREDPFKQHDLLVAEHKQIGYHDAGGHVSLSFDHALAAVQFKVQITNTWKQEHGNALTVNKIVLKNVSNSGDYHYDGKSWTINNSSANYTLTNGNLTVTTDYQELPCGYLFLIPQKRDANGTTGTYIEVTYSNETKTAVIPFDVDWEAGSLYTIEIRLGTTYIK